MSHDPIDDFAEFFTEQPLSVPDARQLTGETSRSTLDLLAWLPEGRYRIADSAGMPALYVQTVSGCERVWLGDWVIRTPNGALRRMTDSAYRASYPSPRSDAASASLRADVAPRGEAALPGPSSDVVCGPGSAPNVPS